MVYNKGIVCLFLLCSVVLMSCTDDPLAQQDDLSVNQWIEKTMRADYLWNDEIPETNKLDFSASPEDFFKSMLSQKDGKTRNNAHHYYSYLEKNKEYVASTRTSIDADDTYGLEFTAYNMINQSGASLGYIFAEVSYVLPNSPASEAGLQRGDWIVAMNGNKITNQSYMNLLKGAAMKLTIGRNNPKELALAASRTVEDDPLYYHAVLSQHGKKIGYLVYNHFTTGPVDHNDHTYDNRMKKIFEDFKAQQVDEFVLDLRYNGGGFLTSASLLAGMFVPERNKEDVFCLSTNNKGKVSQTIFDSAAGSGRLSLSRLYVLTSSSTASASEAVINGLTPFMDVILIGATTEGKNVGSVHYADNKYEWAIQPITFRITSKDTSLDYSAGLPADYPRDESDAPGDRLLPLGDPNEYLLSKALELITGRQSTVKNVAAARTSDRQPIYKSIDRHQSNGVLMTSF